MIDTLEKKVVRGISVQQQQQLSIEILTNLSIKTCLNTRYYRKYAVVKQKARSTSTYMLLSSKVFIQTKAQGVRYRCVLRNKVYIYKQQASIETFANLLNCQQISIDTLASLLNWAIGIDRYLLLVNLYPIAQNLSLIHISEPTRPRLISYAVFCL